LLPILEPEEKYLRLSQSANFDIVDSQFAPQTLLTSLQEGLEQVTVRFAKQRLPHTTLYTPQSSRSLAYICHQTRPLQLSEHFRIPQLEQPFYERFMVGSKPSQYRLSMAVDIVMGVELQISKFI